VHNDVTARDARDRAIELLRRVGIPKPEQRVDGFPHEFSGGMRQRAMIAMALSCDPELLIADEPTTALDVTVQAQILELMLELQAEKGTAIILITHDLGVVGRMADDVLVMYGGRAMESGPVERVLLRPEHPYTWGLLRSVPSLRGPAEVDLVPIPGNPPSMVDRPGGCPFHPRCAYAGRNGTRSFDEVPMLLPTVADPTHSVACHMGEELRREIFRDEIAAGVGAE
jgi:peptide/nickel transport system ATP-binding protein